MKQKMLSWLLVLAVAMMPLFGVTEKAQADDVNDPIQEKMNALQLDLEKYETSGDIQKPLMKQLQNKLKRSISLIEILGSKRLTIQFGIEQASDSRHSGKTPVHHSSHQPGSLRSRLVKKYCSPTKLLHQKKYLSLPGHQSNGVP